MKSIHLLLFLFISYGIRAQAVVHVPIGQHSLPENAEIQLSLIGRIQNYQESTDSMDFKNFHIDSPKSVIIVADQNKFYINSLEGCETVVFDLTTFRQLSVIKHSFGVADSGLFLESVALGYKFKTRTTRTNEFSGKPVEGCLSHNGKYLWVTYYRRSFDQNAIDPSALAIIDTESDSIIRVMPTGPLPKMIACSPDNKYIAVTHWGDNTVAIIDISSDNPDEFVYVKHLVIDYQLSLDPVNNTPVNRDTECGFCLRGTVFSPDSKYLLVGRMGGGGIAIIDMNNLTYLGTVFGMKTNVRHLTVFNSTLYLSSNKTGYVQSAPIDSVIASVYSKTKIWNDWREVFAGLGARTLNISPDGQYIFVAANNVSEVVVIREMDMKVICKVKVDSYPVGLDISQDGTKLIVTSQGRVSVGGGNSVMIFEISKN